MTVDKFSQANNPGPREAIPKHLLHGERVCWDCGLLLDLKFAFQPPWWHEAKSEAKQSWSCLEGEYFNFCVFAYGYYYIVWPSCFVYVWMEKVTKKPLEMQTLFVCFALPKFVTINIIIKQYSTQSTQAQWLGW
jgi:hypothetical protein